MTVYHGSVAPIEKPDLACSKSRVDFGPGFYVTTFRDQAERWALRRAMRMRTMAVVSAYVFNESATGLVVRKFADADLEWLDAVASCRRGVDSLAGCDVVIGPAADDAVFEAVSMYLSGIWDAARTLSEIRYYKRNDQIVFKTERALSTLVFQSFHEVGGARG